MNKKGLSRIEEKELYNLMAINGFSIGNINKKVIYEPKLLSIIIRRYYKRITFDIVIMPNYNIFLKMF